MSVPVYNPVAVESAIRAISDRIAQGVRICNERYTAWLLAKQSYDKAYAHAYMAHQGPQLEKKYAAELATQEERAERDEADAAYKYADRQAKALQDALRAMQSINKSVSGMYSATGAIER